MSQGREVASIPVDADFPPRPPHETNVSLWLRGVRRFSTMVHVHMVFVYWQLWAALLTMLRAMSGPLGSAPSLVGQGIPSIWG